MSLAAQITTLPVVVYNLVIFLLSLLSLIFLLCRFSVLLCFTDLPARLAEYFRTGFYLSFLVALRGLVYVIFMINSFLNSIKFY